MHYGPSYLQKLSPRNVLFSKSAVFFNQLILPESSDYSKYFYTNCLLYQPVENT